MPAHAAQGDGHWDRQFGTPGTASRNLALRFNGNSLYTGGYSVAAGQIATNTVVNVFNGTNWTSLGEITGGLTALYDFAFLENDLYVGGLFQRAGDAPAVGLAKWDGANWSDVGGFSGLVSSLAADGTNLYVGGSFTNAGGNTANRIAVWDGANWFSLGTGGPNGLNGTVNAILADGSDIYVGGSFTAAGGVTARAIARWNGSSWSALREGMFHTSTANVMSLAKLGGYLYACGVFTNAGGSVITRNIARWDGTSWESLGSGIGNEATSGASRATALTVWGNDLFVGGIFETAGVCDAEYIARWNDQIDFTPPSLMRLWNPQLLPGNDFKFRATATERAAYVIEHSADLVNWTPLTTNSLSLLDITNSVPGEVIRSYRMREIP